VKTLAFISVLAASLALPSTASADDEPFVIGSQPIWFLTGGVTTGGTVALDDKGAFVGAELSLTRLRDRHYLGFYADAYYDWGPNGTYLSAGPELGLLKRVPPIGAGIDGGVAIRFADGTDIGGTGRLFLTLAAGLALFGRYTHFGTADNEQIVSVGLTFKVPLYNSF